MTRCIRADCDRRAESNYLCHNHHATARRRGDVLPPPMKRIGGTCIAAGCERQRRKNQRCTMHASRFKKYGSDELPRRTDEQKFAASYRVDPDTGCHIWLRGHDSGGYGTFTPAGSKGAVRAHRWAWMQAYGPVPEGLVLDHYVCDNKGCCNPIHLQPVTTAANMQRSPLSQSTINAQKSHCIRGHAFTPENTYVPPSRATRQCRECIRLRSSRSRSRGSSTSR